MPLSVIRGGGMGDEAMSVTIRQAENGWILSYTRYLSHNEEVYSTQEDLLTRVHQLIGKWEAGDRVVIQNK